MSSLNVSSRLTRAWDGVAQRLRSRGGRREAIPLPAVTADEAEIRLLIQFMSEVGAAMNGAGDATTFIRRSLQRIGRAYGLRNLGVFVLPTLLLLRYGNGRSTFVDLSSQIPNNLRLDQIAALYQLLRDAEEAAVSPGEGIERLHALLATPERFSTLARIASVPLIAGGIILTLEPTLPEVGLTLVLAVLVAALGQSVRVWPNLWPLIPPAAGLLAGTVGFLAIEQGVDSRPVRILIPPLAILLPGAALTVSMIELSNGDVVAGGGRLAYGTIRLFLLVFGILVAARWVGPVDQVIAGDPYTLGRYFAVPGLALFTAGVFVYFTAPRGSLPWLLFVVIAAWAGQQVGQAMAGSLLGGFVGGAVMIAAAQAIKASPEAPPLIVSFTPAFWLLVPGAIGLQGLSQVFENTQRGLEELLVTLLSMISVALGVLFGLILTNSDRIREPE